MDGEPFTLATLPAVGNFLHVTFGPGNELQILDLSDGSTQEPSTASVVQWARPTAGQRRIAYDSLGLYQQLHQSAAEPLSPEGWSATMQYSKTLSSIMAADGVRGAEATADELSSLHERALWDLLSLFFLEASPSGGATGQGLISQDLARWLRSNATAVAGGVAASPLPAALAALLRAASLPEAVPAYWPTVARLVALGWIDDAIELLGLHSAWLRFDSAMTLEAADEASRALVGGLEAATLLLRRFPVLSVPGAAYGAGRECGSPSELATYRRTWQAQCAALSGDSGMWKACEGADISTARGLRSVLGVLAGDEASLAAAASNWLELLVAQLLHVYPTARPQAELRQLAQRAFEAGDGASAPDFLQIVASLLEACSELDAQGAMRVCSSFCSNWFMAHAPDIMAAHPAGASVLGLELPHAGGSQVEFYTLEYACSLMPHPSTWPLAAAYLAWCPAHGQPALEALLRRLPLEAGEGWSARKAAQVARYHGLERLATEVLRTQGVVCWRAGMLGGALSWLARCGDVRRANIVLQPLADAVSAGRVTDEQAAALEALQPVLETLPPGSANAALLEVHRLLQRGGSAAAGGGGGMHAAVSALSQLPEAMRDSCLRLVCGAVPAMPPGELSEADVLYLLQWLLSAEGRLPKGRQGEELAAGVQVARLALVRSLAASHMRT